MGANSTITVSRDNAMLYIMRKLPNCTNDQLERMLDPFLEDRLYNANVVDGGADDNDLLDG